MTDRRDIPPIPTSAPRELLRPLQRMREELQRLMGTRGDPSEAAVTIGNASSVIAGGTGTTVIGTGGSGGGSTEPDLTPPPTVTDLEIIAGLSQVIVSWSGIGYTQGHGNKQTIVYAVKQDPADTLLPTFPGEAGRVAVAPQAMTSISIPSEMNTRWHVWAKFESVDGVLSSDPAGGTNGVSDTTGQDV